METDDTTGPPRLGTTTEPAANDTVEETAFFAAMDEIVERVTQVPLGPVIVDETLGLIVSNGRAQAIRREHALRALTPNEVQHERDLAAREHAAITRTAPPWYGSHPGDRSAVLHDLLGARGCEADDQGPEDGRF